MGVFISVSSNQSYNEVTNTWNIQGFESIYLDNTAIYKKL